MANFLNVTIKQKNLGLQGYEPMSVLLSSDAILLLKQSVSNLHEGTLKPEYLATIKEALGIHGNAEIEYIRVKSSDIKDLLK